MVNIINSVTMHLFYMNFFDAKCAQLLDCSLMCSGKRKLILHSVKLHPSNGRDPLARVSHAYILFHLAAKNLSV